MTKDAQQPLDGRRPADLPRYREEPFGRDAFEDDRYASEPFEVAQRTWRPSPAKVLARLLVGVLALVVVGFALHRFDGREADTAAEQAARQRIEEQARRLLETVPSPDPSRLRPADGRTGPLAMGEPLVLRDGVGNELRVTVDNARLWNKSCKPYPRGGTGAGAGYLVADVTVEVVTGTVSFTEFDLGLKVSEQQIVSGGNGILTGCGEPLDADGLTPGDRRDGRLVFTTAAMAGQIVYLPVVRGLAPVGSWTVT